jgi:hypothetical protein
MIEKLASVRPSQVQIDCNESNSSDLSESNSSDLSAAT